MKTPKPSKRSSSKSRSRADSGVDGTDTQALLDNFVARAVEERAARGSQSGHYTQLLQNIDDCVAALADRVDDVEEERGLASLLLAVERCVSLLRPKAHDSLVAKVLALRPWGCPPGLRAALLSLVAHMALASGQILPHCLAKLVEWVLPARDAPLNLSDHSGPWSPPPEALEIQDQVLACLHHVVARAPSSAEHVARLLVDATPGRLSDRDAQCLHLRAALAFAEDPAGKSCAGVILKGVVDHLLAVDVELKWEDIVDSANVGVREEVAGEREEADIFELEGMTELQIAGEQQRAAEAAKGGWEGAASALRGPAQERPREAVVDETAEKMDSLMEQALSHLDRRMATAAASTSGRKETREAEQVYADVWLCFCEALLPTHRSKFTQFLLFHALARGPASWTSRFVEALVQGIADSARPQVMRCACAAYLASFLARAAFVTETVAVRALEAVVQWCQAYTDQVAAAAPVARHAQLRPHAAVYGDHPSDAGVAESTAHGVLHAAVQAVLYVLCYHLEPLLSAAGHVASSPDADRGAAAAAASRLVQGPLAGVLASPLDPLTHCLPTVAREFARVAAVHRLLDLSRHAAVAIVARPSAGRPLETFFPFDPYLLKRSAVPLQLDDTYVSWRRSHPRGARGVDTESSEESEGAGEEEDGEDDTSSSFSQSVDASSSSSMGIESMQSPMDMGATPGGQDGGLLRYAHRPVALAARRKALEVRAMVPDGATPSESSMMGSMPLGTSVGAAMNWQDVGT